MWHSVIFVIILTLYSGLESTAVPDDTCDGLQVFTGDKVCESRGISSGDDITVEEDIVSLDAFSQFKVVFTDNGVVVPELSSSDSVFKFRASRNFKCKGPLKILITCQRISKEPCRLNMDFVLETEYGGTIFTLAKVIVIVVVCVVLIILVVLFIISLCECCKSQDIRRMELELAVQQTRV